MCEQLTDNWASEELCFWKKTWNSCAKKKNKTTRTYSSDCNYTRQNVIPCSNKCQQPALLTAQWPCLPPQTKWRTSLCCLSAETEIGKHKKWKNTFHELKMGWCVSCTSPDRNSDFTSTTCQQTHLEIFWPFKSVLWSPWRKHLRPQLYKKIIKKSINNLKRGFKGSELTGMKMWADSHCCICV